MNFTSKELVVLHAAMASMVPEIHACQDMMTPDQWDVAESLWARLDRKITEQREEGDREA